MAVYDSGSLTLSSLTAAPSEIMRLTTPSMDAFDHDLNFDGDALLYVASQSSKSFEITREIGQLLMKRTETT